MDSGHGDQFKQAYAEVQLDSGIDPSGVEGCPSNVSQDFSNTDTNMIMDTYTENTIVMDQTHAANNL